MTQPTYAPVPSSGEVRPTVPTATPEFSRAKKPGLLRSPSQSRGTGHGTPAPGEGYAFTLAEHEVAALTFAHEHDRHDVAVGVGVLAAKRASANGRGPLKSDVLAVLNAFGLLEGVVSHEAAQPFAGLAHSYFLQRAFADSVDVSTL